MLPQKSCAATTVGLSPSVRGVAPEEQAVARSATTTARPARRRGARDIVREPSVRNVPRSVNESRSHCQQRHARPFRGPDSQRFPLLIESTAMESDLHVEIAARLKRDGQRYTKNRRTLVEILRKAKQPQA